jgi:hypothetical protein
MENIFLNVCDRRLPCASVASGFGAGRKGHYMSRTSKVRVLLSRSYVLPCLWCDPLKQKKKRLAAAVLQEPGIKPALQRAATARRSRINREVHDDQYHQRKHLTRQPGQVLRIPFAAPQPRRALCQSLLVRSPPTPGSLCQEPLYAPQEPFCRRAPNTRRHHERKPDRLTRLTLSPTTGEPPNPPAFLG